MRYVDNDGEKLATLIYSRLRLSFQINDDFEAPAQAALGFPRGPLRTLRLREKLAHLAWFSPRREGAKFAKILLRSAIVTMSINGHRHFVGRNNTKECT